MSRQKLIAALILAAIGIAAATSLGLWQTRRGDLKLVLQAQTDAAERASVVEIVPSLNAIADIAAALPRKVRVSGVFNAAGSIYLDNRSLGGVAGFYVLTPLVLGADLPAVLVDRGWQARNVQDQTHITVAPPPAGRISVEGLAVARPSTLLELGSTTEQRVPGMWQNLDYSAYEVAAGVRVARFVIRQAQLQNVNVSVDGLRREWPRLGSGVERHRGYAFQWYALATLIAVLAVYFGWKSWRLR